MNIIGVLLVLVVIGAAVYLVNQVIPMVPWMKTVINVVVAVLVVIWLFQIFGGYTGLEDFRFGRH